MKININKTNKLVALFATTLLSTVATAAVPKAELIKAEPVEKINLTNAAHNSLRVSLAPIKVDFTQNTAENFLTKQKEVTPKNQTVTLTKISLVAE